MKAEFFLAWRDFRRKRRKDSQLVGIALTFALVSIIVNSGFNNASIDAFVNNDISLAKGDLKILPDENNVFIKNSYSILNKIDDIPGVAGSTPRLITGGEIAFKTKSEGIQIIGIDPDREIKATSLPTTVINGAFLNRKDKNKILIGNALAEFLKVETGDTIKLKTFSGELNFQVKGILQMGSFEYDRHAAFISYNDLENILGSESEASEIIIKLDNRDNADSFKDILMKETLQTNIKTWKELSVGMSSMISTMSTMSNVISIISSIVAALMIGLLIYTVVVNRTHEIGILKSIGMKNSSVFLIFLIESVLACMIPMLIGNIVAPTVLTIFQIHPIVIEPVSGMEILLVPYASFSIIIFANISVLAMCIIGAMYPAWKASKIDPVEAINYG